jgi:hypothetical protein
MSIGTSPQDVHGAKKKLDRVRSRQTCQEAKTTRAFYTRHELLRQVRDFHCPLERRATLSRRNRVAVHIAQADI